MSFTCKEPKLRFPEFRGEWVEKRIGEVCSTFKSGESITSENIYEKDLYPVFGGNGLRGYTNTFTHDGFYFLIGRQGALCGNINRTNGKAFISEHAIAVEANETSDTEWLAQRLDYYDLNKLSESSAQPGLAVNKLIRFKLFIPSKPEQEKIASFLTAVDAKIEQLTCKEKLLEKYKKSAMQKLFSQELRFTCNDGSEYPEWEEKKLGELFDFLRGSALSKSDIDENGIYKCIHYGELFTTYKEKISHIQSCTNLSEGQFSVIGDILMPSSDVTPQGLATASAIFENNVIIGGDTNILRPKKAINSLFVSYFLNSNKNEIMKAVTGTTVKHIYNKDVAKLIINLPSLPEQTKIANFLSAIDEKCLHVKHQLEQTRQFKKALLQQMFV